MPSAADPGDDPGLARERTALSWQRMALSFISLAAVTLGAAAHRREPDLLIPSAALFAVAGAVWRYSRRRIADRSLATAVRPVALLTAGTAVAALAAAVIVVVQPAP